MPTLSLLLCAGYFGLAQEATGSEAVEDGRKEMTDIVKITELKLVKLTGELTAEHLDFIESFAASIDIGYECVEDDT